MESKISPYEPPNSDLEKELEENAIKVVAAGKWRRFFNFLIDYAAQMALSFAIVFGLLFVIGEEAMEHIFNIPDIVLGIVVSFIYYLPFEFLTSRTLGKYQGCSILKPLVR